MRTAVLSAIAGLAALMAVGCGVQPTDVAPGGAAPAVTIPVGPVPGPQRPLEAPANPFSCDRIAATQGREYFIQYNCYGCHGGHGGGGMGPSLRDQDWIYGDSDAQVFNSIAQGRAHGMPAWGTQLPDDQIWKLVAYVKTLGTNREVEPPPPLPQPARPE